MVPQRMCLGLSQLAVSRSRTAVWQATAPRWQHSRCCTPRTLTHRYGGEKQSLQLRSQRAGRKDAAPGFRALGRALRGVENLDIETSHSGTNLLPRRQHSMRERPSSDHQGGHQHRVPQSALDVTRSLQNCTNRRSVCVVTPESSASDALTRHKQVNITINYVVARL